jgi:hypothetical protein
MPQALSELPDYQIAFRLLQHYWIWRALSRPDYWWDDERHILTAMLCPMLGMT